MTSKEVSEKTGLTLAAVNRWAEKNGVASKPVKIISAYEWSGEDLERFLERPSRGWTKGRARK
jgi:hypothetical protein